ncbi:hypothetical protein CQ12_36690, partial [Bradyrhizobium jicamae]
KDGSTTAAASDGRTAASDGRPAAGGPLSSGQELPAGSPVLIVNGPDPRVWPETALKSLIWKTENPAVFPCFWLESGYIARHLTRKHGSQRPSGGNRASQARLLTRFRRNQPENYHYGAT